MVIEPPHVITLLDSTGKNIVIDWNFPSATEETKYVVQIKGKDGVYYEEKEECDGSEQYIAEHDFCKIRADKLLRDPFNLLYDDPVHTRVYILDEEGEKGELVTADINNAPATYATPDYVTGMLQFGNLNEDWNEMWLH